MAKECSHDGCSYPVFSKGYCMSHWKQKFGKPLQHKPLKQTESGDVAKPIKVGDLFKDKEAKWHDGEFYKAQYRVVSVKPSPKPIKKVSDKQAKLNSAYIVLRNQHLKNKPTCIARLEGCTFIATQVHHPRGRGVYLLDDTLFKGLCENCHQWAETHPEQAKALGLSENRLDKY